MTEPRTLRSFGVVVGGVFLAASFWPVVWRNAPIRLWIAIPAGALCLLGLVAPSLLSTPYALWMRLAHTLGWINTRILLTVLYYLIFTPVAIVMRCIRFDPMNRNFLPAVSSYRVSRKARPASHMDHQF